MPRTVTFKLKNKTIPASFVSFSRDSMYGKKHVERRGAHGTLYQMVSLTADGTHIIPLGGISSSYVNPEGNHVNLRDTKLFDEKQEPLYVTKSMFTHPIELGATISLDHYFGYEIINTYLLQLEDSDQFDSLLKECQNYLKQNKFLRFTYAYYDTTDPQDAILVPKDDAIVVMVGSYKAPAMLEPHQIEYGDEEEIDMEQELLEFDVW